MVVWVNRSTPDPKHLQTNIAQYKWLIFLLVKYNDSPKWLIQRVFHLIVFHFSSLWVKIGKQLYIMLDVINRGYGGANYTNRSQRLSWLFKKSCIVMTLKEDYMSFKHWNVIWFGAIFFLILVNFRLNDFGVILKCFINHQRCRKQWVISYWLVHFKFKCVFFLIKCKIRKPIHFND